MPFAGVDPAETGIGQPVGDMRTSARAGRAVTSRMSATWAKRPVLTWIMSTEDPDLTFSRAGVARGCLWMCLRLAFWCALAVAVTLYLD